MGPERREFFEQLAAESLQDQAALEAASGVTFDEYVAAWYR
jgi:hypothetical protein